MDIILIHEYEVRALTVSEKKSYQKKMPIG